MVTSRGKKRAVVTCKTRIMYWKHWQAAKDIIRGLLSKSGCTPSPAQHQDVKTCRKEVDSPGHRLSGKLGPHHHPLFSSSVVSRHITHIWTRTEIHLNIQHKKYEAQWGYTLHTLEYIVHIYLWGYIVHTLGLKCFWGNSRGQGDDSSGKDTCCQAWWPEFYPGPHTGEIKFL